MGALLIIAALAQVGTPGPAPTTDTTPAKAGTGSITYVDLEGGAGYSSNPNLSVINDRGSAYGRVSVHALHSRVSARSTTLLSAFAEDVSYTSNHGSQQSVNVFARHDTAVSEQARLFVEGSASYQENGQLDTRVLEIPILPPLPGGIVTPPILIPPGGDFLSVTGRELSLAAHAGGSFTLGPRDSASLSSGVERVVFHSGSFRTGYTRVPVSLGYNRKLSDRTSVGASLGASDTEYDGPGSVRVITPQLTARTLLSPTISFDGAIGVSFARVDNGLTVSRSTGLSAQANLCGQGETSYFCAHVYADQQAATTAGPAKSIGGSVDFSQRLDADQTISFSLGLTHYSTPISVVSGHTFSSATYYRAASAYTRRFSPRLYGGVNLAARKLTQNGPDPKTDLNGSLFIRYRFGDVQ